MWLVAATVSAKLLEAAGYRPYELEFEDCAFIRKAMLSAMPHMQAANRRSCSQMLSGTTARLASSDSPSLGPILLDL